MRAATAAEQRFIVEEGLDPRAFLGGVENARLTGSFDAGRPVLGQLESVSIVGNDRFGNAAIQMAAARAIALRSGATRVFHNRLDWFPDDVVLEGVHYIGGEPAPGHQRALHAAFFQRRTLAPLHGPADFVEGLRALRAVVPFDTASVPADDDELHVHLRAGDLFEGGGGHYHYGQPPLAFYRRALMAERWARVTLVFENDTNPVLPGIVELLSQLGIPLSVQSAALFEDITALLRARNLVAARGTFAFPIIAASRHLRRVYSFESAAGLAAHGLDGLGLDLVNFRDTSGDYAGVLSGWQNTAAQHELMRMLPDDALEQSTEDSVRWAIN